MLDWDEASITQLERELARVGVVVATGWMDSEDRVYQDQQLAMFDAFRPGREL